MDKIKAKLQALRQEADEANARHAQLENKLKLVQQASESVRVIFPFFFFFLLCLSVILLSSSLFALVF